MSNFFDKSDLTRKDVDEIVSETLKNCDDGEIYFENSKSESILLDDNKIKSSNYNSDLGFGFRAISNDVVAYSHSCLLYTSPSPRDKRQSRMPSSA